MRDTTDPTGMKFAGDVGRRLEKKVDEVLSEYFLSKYNGKYRLCEDNPLKKMYGLSGVVPDHIIENTETGNRIMIESKNQDAGGNAYERMFKFCTPNMVRLVKDTLDVKYNPIVFICSGVLNTPKFRNKINFGLGDDFDNLFWEGTKEEIANFFETKLKGRLDNE
tara:strand:+ start:278 stop:772 length:495 start_codon:yes stop_codon:yes gene_type:complete